MILVTLYLYIKLVEQLSFHVYQKYFNIRAWFVRMWQDSLNEYSVGHFSFCPIYIIRKLNTFPPWTIDTVTVISIIVTGYAAAVCWYLYLCTLYILKQKFRCYARPSIFTTTLSHLRRLHWVPYEITEVYICYRTGGIYIRWGALRAVDINATIS